MAAPIDRGRASWWRTVAVIRRATLTRPAAAMPSTPCPTAPQSRPAYAALPADRHCALAAETRAMLRRLRQQHKDQRPRPRACARSLCAQLGEMHVHLDLHNGGRVGAASYFAPEDGVW